MTIRLEPGNCLEVMRKLAEEGVKVDAIVCDPPYHLTSGGNGGFMGKAWDGGDVAFNSVTWGMAASLLKPGGWLLAFGGTRTFGKLHWAVEGGGLEVRDCIAWLSGQGFPKSKDVAKGIDAHFGKKGETVPVGDPVRRIRPGADQHKDGSWEKLADREYQPGQYVPATEEAAQWQGFGTALKPAMELVVMARKPPSESSVAANVLKHGTGALNVDGCRVQVPEGDRSEYGVNGDEPSAAGNGITQGHRKRVAYERSPAGRWPANVCHDGSPEVEEAFAAFGEGGGNILRTTAETERRVDRSQYRVEPVAGSIRSFADSGTASRFFYTAKADKHDRWGSKHPTVKPIDLMRWLVRLVTPPGGLVLDPFAGSGTTGIAAMAEGFDAILIEREEEYLADIRERLAFYEGDGRHSLASKHRKSEAGHDDLPLFSEVNRHEA